MKCDCGYACCLSCRWDDGYEAGRASLLPHLERIYAAAKAVVASRSATDEPNGGPVTDLLAAVFIDPRPLTEEEKAMAKDYRENPHARP